MKISVSELKSFKANASFIKQNNIIPVLSYLKLENGCITKNNLNSFLIQKVGKFKESILVEEKILMAFVDNASADEIEISVSGKRILITDGFTKDYSPTDDIINFPTNENGVFDKVEISTQVLSSIKTASTFILSEETMPNKSNIFVGKKSVAGSNGFIAYVKSFDHDLPQMVLSKDVCTAISKFGTINFYESERYHFFEKDNCKFGFIKPTYPFFDLTVFGIFDNEAPHFEVNKFDLIKFNDLAISSPSKKVVATFKVQSEIMKLVMKDADYERDVEKDISVTGEDVSLFGYMPVNLNQLLKNVPDADVTFYQAKNKYYITGESGFTTLIMEVIEPII